MGPHDCNYYLVNDYSIYWLLWLTDMHGYYFTADYYRWCRHDYDYYLVTGYYIITDWTIHGLKLKLIVLLNMLLYHFYYNLFLSSKWVLACRPINKFTFTCYNIVSHVWKQNNNNCCAYMYVHVCMWVCDDCC